MKPAPLNEILKTVIARLNAGKTTDAKVYTKFGEVVARPYFRIERITPSRLGVPTFPNYRTYITVQCFADKVDVRNDMVNDIIVSVLGPIEIEGRESSQAELFAADTFTEETEGKQIFRGAVTIEIRTTDEH